jgi:hypothetical protein
VGTLENSWCVLVFRFTYSTNLLFKGGVPYFLHCSGVTRELFDLIVELRPSTRAGRPADNVKRTLSFHLLEFWDNRRVAEFHLLEYKKRHLAYLDAFKTRLIPRIGLDSCVLQPLEPYDRAGCNGKSITDDLITDIL